MKKYDYILFDLDGTLIDSGPGIMRAMTYALDKMGKQVDNPDDLHACIGPPLSESFKKLFNIEESQIKQAIDYYRECYRGGAIFEATLYPGIVEMLKQIKEMDYKIVMATSKPEHFAKMIAEKMGFEQYFDFIGGSTFQETRTSKREVIEYVLEQMGNPPIERVVMVGDRKYDVIGAAECGIETIGVLYGGYGTREEMLEANAKYVAETPEEILNYI